MQTEWLERNNSTKLILFFAGWGMNGSEMGHLDAGDFDVLCFYDYRDLSELPEIDGVYDEVYVVAWSFGVACAGPVFSRLNLPEPVKAVAINGTLKPVDDECGIPPQVFQGTLETYSLENREKFLRRTCGSRENLEFFMQQANLRNAEEQCEELAILEDFFATISERNIFTTAVVGTKDRIIPAQNQQFFWEQANARIVTIDGAAHYPFQLWQSWQEIVEL